MGWPSRSAENRSTLLVKLVMERLKAGIFLSCGGSRKHVVPVLWGDFGDFLSRLGGRFLFLHFSTTWTVYGMRRKEKSPQAKAGLLSLSGISIAMGFFTIGPPFWQASLSERCWEGTARYSMEFVPTSDSSGPIVLDGCIPLAKALCGQPFQTLSGGAPKWE